MTQLYLPSRGCRSGDISDAMVVYSRSNIRQQRSLVSWYRVKSPESREDVRVSQTSAINFAVNRLKNKESLASLTWTIDVCWHARQTSPLGGSLMAKSVRANPCRWPCAPCIQHQARTNAVTRTHARTWALFTSLPRPRPRATDFSLST